MTVLIAARAAAGFPVAKFSGGGVLQVAYGTYPMTANPTAADTIKMCKLPAGAVVLDGFLRGQDLDTGSATLDIDVGWLGNGGAGTDDAVNSLGFGDLGVLNGTTVANYLPETGFIIPLHGVLATRPVAFTNETTLTLTFVAASATFAAGSLTLVVYYVVP